MAKKKTSADKPLRLDKYLADMCDATRSEVKEWLKRDRVTVDGQIRHMPDYKVMPGESTVCLDGQAVGYVEYEYLMFHKPAGCVSATEDKRDKTVLDYISKEDCARKSELFPVGRLDKDSEGLLLLTNDGELSHRLLSPRRHVQKRYFVRLEHGVEPEMARKFEEGLDIGDEKPTLPAKLECTQEDREVYVTITEGRYHQIKRMFHACGNEVVYLKRVSMGSLMLDEGLKKGEYRPLTEEELSELHAQS